MHADSARALQSHGGDPEGFVARQLTARMVEEAELTLTMTRKQRRQVLEIVPRALPRTFTLREAAGLLELAGADDPPGDTFHERGVHLVDRLARARCRRPGCDEDDIEDVVGRPLRVHESTATLIRSALRPLLGRLAALTPAAPTAVPAVARLYGG
jgi:protein-tyrosine phosphatase